MNMTQARGIWPLIKAYGEGKTIQVLSGNAWKDVADPLFTTDYTRYRVKPEQREIWVNEYPSGLSCAYSTKEAADRAGSGASLRCTHYIEVV